MERRGPGLAKCGQVEDAPEHISKPLRRLHLACVVVATLGASVTSAALVAHGSPVLAFLLGCLALAGSVVVALAEVFAHPEDP